MIQIISMFISLISDYLWWQYRQNNVIKTKITCKEKNTVRDGRRGCFQIFRHNFHNASRQKFFPVLGLGLGKLESCLKCREGVTSDLVMWGKYTLVQYFKKLKLMVKSLDEQYIKIIQDKIWPHNLKSLRGVQVQGAGRGLWHKVKLWQISCILYITHQRSLNVLAC